ncbi:MULTISPECIES: hypothetical protein [unclassified Rhodococcus (in: high G+C Gram-positive bacteria)]|uniref:hypothetical protein n=1 Tax=Rhodococcus sp. SJ-3 TaxID=3454628 RepID=UPI003F79EA28
MTSNEVEPTSFSGERSVPGRFGETPLRQTERAASSLRRLSGLLLSLEHEHDVVDEMLSRFAEWEQILAAEAPSDTRLRLADDRDDDRRVYLDHAFDVGSFNPHFPEYELRSYDADSASGTVYFPVVYEGPPGLVHGGFLAVFFDCMIQHHNCAVGVAGKTRLLSIRYRRPTPLLTPLDFDVVRRTTERGLVSEARLMRNGEVLCIAELDSVAVRIDALETTELGRRR